MYNILTLDVLLMQVKLSFDYKFYMDILLKLYFCRLKGQIPDIKTSLDIVKHMKDSKVRPPPLKMTRRTEDGLTL